MLRLLDANVFITAKNTYYGLDLVPAFWDWLESQAADGALASTDLVYDELKDGGDELNAVLKASMGPAAIANVTTQIHTVDGHDVCRVHVRPCGFPVEAKVTEIDKRGQHQKKTNFYARINNGTHKFTDDNEKQKYIAQRWPS